MLLEIDGIRVVTDPVLRDRVGPLVRLAAGVRPEAIGAVDSVLLSHLHADHTDIPTLRRLSRSGPVVTPRGARAWLAGQGIEDLRELLPGEQLLLDGLSVTATPAIHDRRRRPFGPSAQPIGYLIRGSRSVYFAGDTDLFPEMADLRGLVDVALLPVWGWGSRLGPGHLDPGRAAAATALIAPSVAIPIHWGTFAVRGSRRIPGDPDRPARDFAALTKRRAPQVEVRLLAPGERTEF